MHLAKQILACLALAASLALAGAALASPNLADPMPAPLAVDSFDDSVASLDRDAAMVFIVAPDAPWCDPVLQLARGECYVPVPAGAPILRQALAAASATVTCIAPIEHGPPG